MSLRNRKPTSRRLSAGKKKVMALAREAWEDTRGITWTRWEAATDSEGPEARRWDHYLDRWQIRLTWFAIRFTELAAQKRIDPRATWTGREDAA